MYAPNVLIQQVIKLFTEMPDYRDDRFKTIDYIVKNYYFFDYGKSYQMDYKIMSDIDRAFRYIQQHSPELRGNEWIKRQRKGGEISKEEYESLMDNKMEELVVKQLKLF